MLRQAPDIKQFHMYRYINMCRADFKKKEECVLLKRLRDPESLYLNKVRSFTKYLSLTSSLVFLKRLKPIRIQEQVFLCSLFLKNVKIKERPQKTVDVFGMFINLVKHAEEVTRKCSYITFCKIHRKTPVSESFFKQNCRLISCSQESFFTA